MIFKEEILKPGDYRVEIQVNHNHTSDKYPEMKDWIFDIYCYRDVDLRIEAIEERDDRKMKEFKRIAEHEVLWDKEDKQWFDQAWAKVCPDGKEGAVDFDGLVKWYTNQFPD